jgi:hypothetical protein
VVTGSSAGTVTSLVLWTGTAAQYNAIATKSATTVYVVTGATVLAAEAFEQAIHDGAGVATGKGEA